MNVSVLLSPSELSRGSLQGRSAVVIDVIRASTTIAAALAHGASAVIPALGGTRTSRRAWPLMSSTNVPIFQDGVITLALP